MRKGDIGHKREERVDCVHTDDISREIEGNERHVELGSKSLRVTIRDCTSARRCMWTSTIKQQSQNVIAGAVS